MNSPGILKIYFKKIQLTLFLVKHAIVLYKDCFYTNDLKIKSGKILFCPPYVIVICKYSRFSFLVICLYLSDKR